MLQAVLGGLDRRYADQLAHLHLELDQVVFNPARLTKLYGTWARKGDNTADIPHRLSRIIALPEARTPVSRELLKRIAGCAISQEAPRTKAPVQASGKIDVEAYLARYGREVSQVKPHGDATLYCLAECIFDSTHTDKEAAIGQAADGQLFYQCFHKSCKGRTWKDARQKISGAAKLGEAKPTQAELLIKLAGDAELFHDLNRKGYATIRVDGHKETCPIKSLAFRDWLRGQFYKAHNKTPGGQALQDTLDLLAAQARYDGPEREVYVRIAHMADKIYVDLANESWQAVEITPQGWSVVNNPPVKFRRPRGLAPMVTPEPGGNLVDLRPFINCREEEWPLVVAWLIGSFSSDPYPIMIFQGEQGTAKGTTARALKNVLDPGHSPQRTAPRDVRDLMISASNSWSLSFDNLSNLSPWLSDSFCRLATGGGLSTRELYSDDNETILDAMRPVILNGIDSLVSRAHLASRAILLELPQIENGRRRPEKDLWKAFEAAQPGILGAVFKAVSAALANVHGVKLPELPRMADFAIWVVAAEPALPWEPGTFLDAYSGNRAAVVEHSLEGDVVAVAVRAFMAERGTWEGAPSALLEALETITPESTIRSKAWPKAANSLSNRLRRAATFLRAIGIKIETGYVKRARRLLIRKGMQKTVAIVETVASQENQGVTCNDACNDATMHEKRPLQPKPSNHAGCNDSNDGNDKNPTLSKDPVNLIRKARPLPGRPPGLLGYQIPACVRRALAAAAQSLREVII